MARQITFISHTYSSLRKWPHIKNLAKKKTKSRKMFSVLLNSPQKTKSGSRPSCPAAGQISYNKSMAWYKDKVFWIIVAGAGLIKLATLLYLFFFGPLGESVLAFPDSLTYIYPAQTWLAYGQFWEAVSANPMLLRTPGYPIFLAIVQLLTNNMTWAVAVVQNILSLLLLLPIYLTTQQLAGKTAARWSTGFCAASALYFSLAFAVLTETLCVFLLAWFMFFIVRWLENSRARDLFFAALSLNAAIYVRPAAYYFVIPAYVFFAVIAARKKSPTLVKQTFFCFLLPLCSPTHLQPLRHPWIREAP